MIMDAIWVKITSGREKILSSRLSITAAYSSSVRFKFPA